MKLGDECDAAYLLVNMHALYKANPKQACYDRDVPEDELMGKLWVVADEASDVLVEVVDFSEGWDGVFSYEELDDSGCDGLAHLLYHQCVLGEAEVGATVNDYAVERDWPLRGESHE